MMSVGSAFKLKRMSLGLDRRQLAKLLSVTPGWIKHVEIGLKPPGATLVLSLDTLCAMVVDHDIDTKRFLELLGSKDITPFQIAVATRFQTASLTLAETIKLLEAGE